jgi:hypothetical protein
VVNFTTLLTIVDLVGKLMVPLIAVIAVYIAYQQWRTNNLKLKLDLFERRLQICDNLLEVIRKINATGVAKYENLNEFHTATEQATFLFGPDINFHLEKFRLNLIKLASLCESYTSHASGNHPKENIQAIIDEMHDLRIWFGEQFVFCERLFGKYLNIHVL